MSKRPDFLHLCMILVFMATSRFAFTAAPHVSVVQFQTAKKFPVGVTPNCVTTADLNGDGKLDLAVSNLSGTISILLGNGDGSFQPANTFIAGTKITSVTAADLNGDSKPDLVILDVTASGGKIGVLLNNGDGTFGTVQFLSGISDASTFAVGDLNGDMKMDIVVGDKGATPAVHVFIGNGNGTFGSPLDFAPPYAPVSILLADFNDDGRPDLVVIDTFNTDLRLGNGDGTFQLPVQLSELLASTILTGDLNQDGKIDIAEFYKDIVNINDPNSYFQARLGNGDGTFPRTIANGVTKGVLSQLADVDGDQVPDALADSGDGSVFVWLNHGDATFQVPFTVVAGGSSGGMVAADFNGDGANDLVVTNPGQNTVSVLLNAATQISLNPLVLSPSLLSRGQSSTGTVTVNMLNSFVKPVTLSCQVTPQGQAQGTVPTCLIQPRSVTPGPNASATANLTLSTNSSSASSFPRLRYMLLAVACLGLLSLGGNWSKKRCAVLVMIGGLALQAACGGNGTPPPPPPSIYTVTVSANAGSAQQATSTTLTVQ